MNTVPFIPDSQADFCDTYLRSELHNWWTWLVETDCEAYRDARYRADLFGMVNRWVKKTLLLFYRVGRKERSLFQGSLP